MTSYRPRDSMRAEMYEKKVEDRVMSDRGKNEWDNEADYYEYIEEGFKCEIQRTENIGCLCGYVTLPKDHKYYGNNYDNINLDFDIHGGLTFSAMTENGEWKIGFDCAHFSDIVPRFIIKRPSMYEENNCTYKNVDFVKKEISKLIEQLKAE